MTGSPPVQSDIHARLLRRLQRNVLDRSAIQDSRSTGNAASRSGGTFHPEDITNSQAGVPPLFHVPNAMINPTTNSAATITNVASMLSSACGIDEEKGRNEDDSENNSLRRDMLINTLQSALALTLPTPGRKSSHWEEEHGKSNGDASVKLTIGSL